MQDPGKCCYDFLRRFFRIFRCLCDDHWRTRRLGRLKMNDLKMTDKVAKNNGVSVENDGLEDVSRPNILLRVRPSFSSSSFSGPCLFFATLSVIFRSCIFSAPVTAVSLGGYRCIVTGEVRDYVKCCIILLYIQCLETDAWWILNIILLHFLLRDVVFVGLWVEIDADF